MAIGTSGYIEAVHLQQAPLKPDSGLKAAKMLAAIGNLAGASMDLYKVYNTPTNEQLVDLRQTFDAGINEITGLGEDADYTSQAISDWENNFNTHLDSLGFQYKEQMQSHLYNATKPFYDAPATLQQNLAIQQDNLAIDQLMQDAINTVNATGGTEADKALAMTKEVSKISADLTPSEKYKYGPKLQELVSTYSATAANAEGDNKKAVREAKTLSQYTAKITNVTNSLLSDSSTQVEKANKFNKFSDNILKEAEANNPEIYKSLSAEIDRQRQLYSAKATKEVNDAERNQIIFGNVTKFTNGEITVDQAMAPFAGRADKVQAQTDFLNTFASAYKGQLSEAAQLKNPAIYNAVKNKLQANLDALNEHLFFGQNNNIESINQYSTFRDNIKGIDTTIRATLGDVLKNEGDNAIRIGDYKKAAETARTLSDFEFGTKANELNNKIISKTKLSNELALITDKGTFDIDVPSSNYASASKEAKERITQIMSGKVVNYFDRIKAAPNPEVRKEIENEFTSFLTNKSGELKGVQDSFKTMFSSIKSVEEIKQYASLIDNIGGHPASIILGEQQVKEINNISVLAEFLPDLEPGREVLDIRNRLSEAEGRSLQGKVLESYKDSVSRSNEIPVPEARDGYVKSTELIYKVTDVKTAEMAAEKLFEKAKGNYIQIENSYVVGVPNTAFQKPKFYEQALDTAVKALGEEATISDLSETHNIQQLPSGDVAFVPKTGAGTSTQTMVLSKQEVIQNLEKNYDGSPEMYEALRDAVKTDTQQGGPNRADVIHKLWKEANKDTVGARAEHLIDNVSNSVVGDVLNIVQDKAADLVRDEADWWVYAYKDEIKWWDWTVQEVGESFEGAVGGMIEGLDNLLFGEEQPEEEGVQP